MGVAHRGRELPHILQDPRRVPVRNLAALDHVRRDFVAVEMLDHLLGRQWIAAPRELDDAADEAAAFPDEADIAANLDILGAHLPGLFPIEDQADPGFGNNQGFFDTVGHGDILSSGCETWKVPSLRAVTRVSAFKGWAGKIRNCPEPSGGGPPPTVVRMLVHSPAMAARSWPLQHEAAGGVGSGRAMASFRFGLLLDQA